MPQEDYISFFASLGVGGILAGLMFYFYRKDSNEWTEAWKGQSGILIQVVKENTVAITALITEIKSRNGK